MPTLVCSWGWWPCSLPPFNSELPCLLPPGVLQWDPPALAYAFHTAFVDCADGGVVRATGGPACPARLPCLLACLPALPACSVGLGHPSGLAQVSVLLQSWATEMVTACCCPLLSMPPSLNPSSPPACLPACLPACSPQAGCSWQQRGGGGSRGAGGLLHRPHCGGQQPAAAAARHHVSSDSC